MNTLLLALALVAPLDSVRAELLDVNSAPTYSADPYAYRPWVRLEIVQEIITESQIAKGGN